jgi:hypothetical protein
MRNHKMSPLFVSSRAEGYSSVYNFEFVFLKIINSSIVIN